MFIMQYETCNVCVTCNMKFSKVSALASFLGKRTIEMTFENFYSAVGTGAFGARHPA